MVGGCCAVSDEKGSNLTVVVDLDRSTLNLVAQDIPSSDFVVWGTQKVQFAVRRSSVFVALDKSVAQGMLIH